MNIEPRRTKQYAHKTKWSEEEVQTFFGLFPDFGSNFKLYLPHLNRTYSQIKGFYHNYQRKAELQLQNEISDHQVQKPLSTPKTPQQVVIGNSIVAMSTEAISNQAFTISISQLVVVFRLPDDPRRPGARRKKMVGNEQRINKMHISIEY
ncbi:Conserved_hypothetical protein [Hexamita inflata]|uniref:Uncharacterized protein n=1 Tax=Hexamita inflata TaxID=28002 RepID=A0AA86TW64_9EUKA|nr:Conserved hypothetical protein [Hexamita inflata]CAI9929397.1 Conserved hypothetical protein [Hexamita inflata]CAI9929399.1 Conserved hypothetical protein [Hexamita inflata]